MALVANMGPSVEFDAPDCIPARYGLLSVAEVEDVSDGHWLAKFHTRLESCDDLEVRAIQCEGEARTTPKITEGSGLSYPESDPFTMVAPFECSTGGMRLSEAWEHAEARLDQGEARSLERTFWTGRDRFGNPLGGTLGGDPDVVDLTPAEAVSITDGVALLEQWAGENMPCAPVLHAARGLAVYLAERTLIEPSGNVMYSRGTGSRVAVGGGYSTTGPGGVVAPAGEGWLWVTGAVKVLRGPKFFTPDRGDVASAVDRVVNDITVFAERNYGVTRGCGLAAIRVNLKSCCC